MPTGVFRNPEERSRKISEGKMGNKNPMFGKSQSDKAKALARERFRDSGNPSWRGGGDSEIKKQIMKRDSETCQKCGLKDKDIVVIDHIKPKAIYPELRYAFVNLQILCPNCHARKTNKEKMEIINFKKNKNGKV